MTDTLKRTTTIAPTWCPGCGNFAILGAIKNALNELKVEPHRVVFTYDVGCSSNMADFVYGYGFHGLHGRSLPPAAGIKLANPDLKVFSIVGDGGGYGEGVGHFLSLARANHDITVIAHDNFLYSLTTGQKSPTTPKGQVTPSTPFGVFDEPFNPLLTALTNSASFVARGFAGDIPGLTKLLVAATSHVGFSFIDVLQPCPTFNKTRPYTWYREHIYDLEKSGHNKTDLSAAMKVAQENDKFGIGIFYQVPRPAFHQNYDVAKQALSQQSLTGIDLSQLVGEFK